MFELSGHTLSTLYACVRCELCHWSHMQCNALSVDRHHQALGQVATLVTTKLHSHQHTCAVCRSSLCCCRGVVCTLSHRISCLYVYMACHRLCYLVCLAGMSEAQVQVGCLAGLLGSPLQANKCCLDLLHCWGETCLPLCCR